MFAALEKGVGKDTTLVKPSALVEASKVWSEGSYHCPCRH